MLVCLWLVWTKWWCGFLGPPTLFWKDLPKCTELQQCWPFKKRACSIRRGLQDLSWLICQRLQIYVRRASRWEGGHSSMHSFPPLFQVLLSIVLMEKQDMKYMETFFKRFWKTVCLFNYRPHFRVTPCKAVCCLSIVASGWQLWEHCAWLGGPFFGLILCLWPYVYVQKFKILQP